MENTLTKKQEVLKELKKWFSQTNVASELHDKRITAIQDFIEKKTNPKSCSLPFERLDVWYSNKFVFDSLENNDFSTRKLVAENGFYIVELSSILAAQFPGNPPKISFHFIAKYLAYVLIEGWYEQAQALQKYILQGLDSSFLKGGQNFSRSAWFIINISCKAFKNEVDVKKYNYPSDMAIFEEVIANWDEKDENLIDKLVSSLCDYHLKEAGYSTGNKLYEFDWTDQFIYAYEILSWLSLRKMVGLKNPERFAHPLMQLPINSLPQNLVLFAPNQLYTQVLKRLKQEFPDVIQSVISV